MTFEEHSTRAERKISKPKKVFLIRLYCYRCCLIFRLNFSTAWSTNAVSICQSAGLSNVTRVELSRRFLIQVWTHTRTVNRFCSIDSGLFCLFMFSCLSSLQPRKEETVTDLNGDLKKLIECLYDSMTECIYQHPITSFSVDTKPQPVFEVDILGKGRAALETANDELGETVFTVSLCRYFRLGLSPSVLWLLSHKWVLNAHLTLSFFMPLSSLAAICEYTVCVLVEVIMSHDAWHYYLAR